MDKAPSRFWPEISNPRTPCSVSGDVRWHEGSQFTEVSLSLCDAQIFSGATPSDTGGDRCRCVAHFHLKVKVVLPPIKGLGESFVMSLRTEEKHARAEAARRRTTRCRAHRTIGCDNSRCARTFDRPSRSTQRLNMLKTKREPQSWLPLIDAGESSQVETGVYSAFERSMSLRELITQKQKVPAVVDCVTA
jgi:hypothetical protein